MGKSKYVLSRKRTGSCAKNLTFCGKRSSHCTIAGMRSKLKGYSTISPWRMSKAQLCRELHGHYGAHGQVFRGYRGTRSSRKCKSKRKSCKHLRYYYAR